MSRSIYRDAPAGGEAEGLLVLHHGRGADEHDLLGLADVLDPQRRLHVVTPRGPLTVPGWPGNHWYVVPRVGYPDPDTFDAAYAKLAAFHDELWERTGIAPARTVLGGFSMGSVMSYALGLGRRPARGRRDPRLLRLHPDRRGLGARPRRAPRPTRVFIAHGRQDPVMDVEFARRASDAAERRRAAGRVPRVRRRPPDRPVARSGGDQLVEGDGRPAGQCRLTTPASRLASSGDQTPGRW